MSYIGNQPTNVAFVTDTFSGTGTTTAFTMSVAPASTTSVLVAITGVLQDPSTYSVSGTTLTFSAAPPSGTSNISVRYLGIPASGVTTTAYRTVTNFTATAGQTTFTPPSYTAGYIDVYRNGSKLALADFTATNGTTVVLAAGCNAGDVVETDSFYVSSVLNAIPATAGAVNSTYIAAGAVGQTALASGTTSNGPTVYVGKTTSTEQTISTGTWTKATSFTKVWDTSTGYDTTNSRYIPNVAGYYQVGFSGQMDYVPTGRCLVSIYKNGSAYLFKECNLNSPASTYPCMDIHGMIYMNGTTDYIEAYVYQASGGNKTLYAGSGGGSSWATYLYANLVRSA